MTLTGDSAYRTEASATYDPPFMGMKESTTADRGALRRRLHADGLAPGDLVTADRPDDQHRSCTMRAADAARPPRRLRQRRSPPPSNRPPTKADTMAHNLFDTLQQFKLAAGSAGQFYSLPALEKAGVGKVSRLPVSIRIVLEIGAAQLRRQEGHRGARARARQLEADGGRASTRSRSSSRASCCRTSPACRCSPTSPRCATSPRDMGKNPKMIEPLVPVDLVVDHSVMIDHYGTQDALDLNMKLEFERNARALRVHEVGHAGVRHVQGRAAGHRHRPPGQPRVPGARRAPEGRRSTTPTRWSAPTATRR